MVGSRLRWGLQRAVTAALLLSLPLTAAAPAPPAAATRAATTTTAPTGASSQAAPLDTLAPRPGALVPAGDSELRAIAHEPVTSARFVVDGEPLVAAIEEAADGSATLRAEAVLPPGTRRLRVEAEGQSGPLTRDWQVTATDRVIRRHAGSGRLETAVAVSAAALPQEGSAPAAVLARADDFADALAGAPLATAVGGPLLLSARDALPGVVAAELRRVVAPGGAVHLLGGTAALDDAVEAAVADLGFRPVRHQGADRYGTAAAIAAALPPADAVLLASGTAFPDALAASAAAARAGMPILLTAPRQLPRSTSAALAGVAAATIAGGTAAVGAEVERAVAAAVGEVRRAAGADRYATAAAIAAAFPSASRGVSLASGTAFPDALSGARHAASLDQALLLTAPAGLPRATDEVLRALRPERIDLYGGAAAVGDHTAVTALRAAVDGPAGPRVRATRPAQDQAVAALREVAIELDRPVDVASSSVYVEAAGRELRGVVAESGASPTLTFHLADGQVPSVLTTPLPGRVVLRAVTADGAVGHAEVPFTLHDAGGVFARTGPLDLHLPSRGVALVGYHQANHPGAQDLVPRPGGPVEQTTLPTRDRRTGARSAADVVASPALPVLAPVSGRVVRGGSYVLYCRHQDDYVVIEPDTRPGWEVKVLHFHGIRVGPGDRVEAGQTVIGAGPRLLPFASQVDRFTSTGWPHLHVEVVDPSVPTSPGGGC